MRIRPVGGKTLEAFLGVGRELAALSEALLGMTSAAACHHPSQGQCWLDPISVSSVSARDLPLLLDTSVSSHSFLHPRNLDTVITVSPLLARNELKPFLANYSDVNVPANRWQSRTHSLCSNHDFYEEIHAIDSVLFGKLGKVCI